MPTADDDDEGGIKVRDLAPAVPTPFILRFAIAILVRKFEASILQLPLVVFFNPIEKLSFPSMVGKCYGIPHVINQRSAGHNRENATLTQS